YAEGLKRIARSGENDFHRFLLAECLEAYADLDEAQKRRLEALLPTGQDQEVRPIMITTYERGINQGIIQGERQLAISQLEARFGPLPRAVKQRVEALASPELRQIMLEYYKAQSLKDLGLEE